MKPGRFLKDPKDVVVALRLLVLAGLAMLGIGEAPEHRFLFWFTTAVYGVTNLGYLFSRAAHFVSPRVQLAIDKTATARSMATPSATSATRRSAAAATRTSGRRTT